MSTALGRAAGRPLARPQAALAAVLAGLAALAWWGTGEQMGGMGSAGLELGGLAFFAGVWVLMMAAMMFPSLAPMVIVYDRLRSARRAREPGAPGIEGTALFVAGYLVTWTAAGLAAYGIVEVGRALEDGALAWDRAGRELTGGVLLASAAFQLTPLKHACLTRCRGPLSFVLEHWRGGRRGALRMGALHGAWCVGCCWALMATLFALGVMSLGWMAFVAALIAVEKLSPRPAWPLVAVVLLVLALAVLAAPELVPGIGGGGAGAPMAM